MKIKITLTWKSLVALNLLAGLFLWFLYATDFSLNGTIPDLLFPVLVLIFAFVSLFITFKKTIPWWRILVFLAHLPSILGGGLFFLTTCLLFVPPFTLGTMFQVSEIAGETLIQRATSPDGSRAALVYFRPVGAYTSGSGRVFIRVRRTLIPFLERDIYYVSSSHAHKYTSDYLQWQDNDTIYIPETDEEIPVGIIKPEIPEVIIIPYGIFRFFATLINSP